MKNEIGSINVDVATEKSRKNIKHACLKIEREWLVKYYRAKGTTLVLEFDFHNKKMKLRLKGFSETEHEPIVNERLENTETDCLEHANPGYGFFVNNDGNLSLHKLLADVKEEKDLTNWFLKPIQYDATSDYVSYELTNEGSLVTYRINPTPPGNQ